jgi:hypothetical protein
MSLTPIQHRARRRTSTQLAHIAAVADLSSRAERIRYACEQLAATDQQITPHLVRTWLAEHNAPEDPDDARQRSYVSRTVNQWRHDHQAITAPTDQNPATAKPNDRAEDESATTAAPTENTTQPPSDTDAALDPAETVHALEALTALGFEFELRPDVHTPVHTTDPIDVPQATTGGADPDPEPGPQVHVHSTPTPAGIQVTDADADADVHEHSTRAGASTPAPSVHTHDPDPVHIPVHTRVHTDILNGAAEPVPDVHALLHDLCTKVGANTTTATVHRSVHDGVHSSTPPAPTAELVKRSRRVRYVAYGLLAVVAVAGAVLSYDSLATKAREYFPPELAHMFPVLVDLLIVGASLAFLAGAMIGRGRPGWRLLAHAGVVGTVTLNALASSSAAGIPWHVTPAIVWAVLVELIARDLLGDYRATHTRPDRIPLALWLTAPGESTSTWLRVRRQVAHASARTDVGTHAAAREALRMALPGLQARRVRRIIARQLRAGSVSPQTVLEQATALMQNLDPSSPDAVLRDVLTRTTQPPSKPTQ